jgi:hypothetical protein
MRAAFCCLAVETPPLLASSSWMNHQLIPSGKRQSHPTLEEEAWAASARVAAWQAAWAAAGKAELEEGGAGMGATVAAGWAA